MASTKNKTTKATTKAKGKGKQARVRQARERLAAERAARARRQRRVRTAVFGGLGLVVVVLVTVIVWAVSTRPEGDATNKALPSPAASVGTGKPPWPVPADPLAGARAAGLDVTNMEGTAKHFHAHLDVLVHGKPVPVAANIGVAPTGGMSELHTHDQSGILHVEAPTATKRYILGHLFRTWQVRLDTDHLGGLDTGGGNTLRAYVDGKRVPGNPAAIELKAHQQIALVYGPADADVKIPSSYDFPPNL